MTKAAEAGDRHRASMESCSLIGHRLSSRFIKVGQYMQNRYSFGIHTDLTPAELFFFIAVDETMKELGIDEVVGSSKDDSRNRRVCR